MLETKKAEPADLRILRAKFGFSRETMARHFGVTPQTLGRWERGPKVPPDLYERMQEVEKALAPPPPPPDRAAGIDKRTLRNYYEIRDNLAKRDRTVEEWHAGQHKNGTKSDAAAADRYLAIHRQLTGQDQ